VKYELSIVIPTYNEESRIGETLKELAKYLKKEKIKAEVLIVDAGSPDKTTNVIEEHTKDFDELRIINAGPKPKGKFIKGKQVKKGMLEAKGEYVLFMDADLATPLKYIREALSQLKAGNQVSICIRNLQQSHKGVRKLISSTGNLLVQTLLLPGISDTQCGFKAFTHDAAQSVFPLQTIDSWGFDMEILAIARKHGYSIGLIKVPDWVDVKEGSKISGGSPIKASVQTLGDLTKIKWRSMRGKYKA
jgi:dolichyl-phosphate beta-glucosyltransferase